ncbi:uncharacterized protein [Venturia canescens]|uniref:uncharacterized protein n=1 Tax=Venturia canescens TaxID=32260 RepID=UPI001C9BDEC4|nr:uncharacterized protein LOC122408409 [Venturia canescens]
MFRNFLVFVLLALSLVLNSNAHVPITTFDSACFEEAGISEHEFEKRIPTLLADLDSMSDKESCYFSCIGKKSGEILDDGILDLDGFRTRAFDMTDEQYLFLKNCTEQTEVNPCQATKKSILCVKQLIAQLETEYAATASEAS